MTDNFPPTQIPPSLVERIKSGDHIIPKTKAWRDSKGTTTTRQGVPATPKASHVSNTVYTEAKAKALAAVNAGDFFKKIGFVEKRDKIKNTGYSSRENK